MVAEANSYLLSATDGVTNLIHMPTLESRGHTNRNQTKKKKKKQLRNEPSTTKFNNLIKIKETGNVRQPIT